MNVPELTLKHTATAFPVISLTTARQLIPGELLHLCTVSFRLFNSAKLSVIRALSADGNPIDDALEIIEKDGQPERHFMKRSLVALEIKKPLPSGTVFAVELTPVRDMVNVAGDLEWDLRLAVIEEQAFEANVCRFPLQDVAGPLTIRLMPDCASQLQAYRRFNGELLVRTTDAQCITTRSDGITAKVEMESEHVDCAFDETGVARMAIDLASDGLIRVASDRDLTATANALPKLSSGQNVFFGDIHWHTAFSTDGQRDLDKAMRSCRDELGLDFAGPSDHILDEGDYGRSTVQDQAAICQKYDDPGGFATIPGFELSRRYGHCNIYTSSWDKLFQLAQKFEKRFCHVLKANPYRYCVEELVELFEDEETLVIPHHTNMDNAAGKGQPGTLPAWGAFHWPDQIQPKHLRLIEFNQQRGSFESEIPDPLWQPPFWHNFRGGLGGSAQTGLGRGHRIGFIGGTDNHNGWPTMEGNGHAIGGITGVIAETLDSASIHAALHARRCYATTGARIVAQATLNGQPIGTELTLEATAERQFMIHIRGTAPLEQVEIISFGQVAHSFTVEKDATSFHGEWPDDRAERPVEDVYYYVRARQSDGHLIWLSPWWVDLAE